MKYSKVLSEIASILRREAVRAVREIFQIVPAGPPSFAANLYACDSPPRATDSLFPAGTYKVAPGHKAYLVGNFDVDVLLTGLRLSGHLKRFTVTSLTSNGIRDQNLMSESGISAEAFSFKSPHPIVIDAAPTMAKQLVVVEVYNHSSATANIRGTMLAACAPNPLGYRR
jgi:hypothetical protein